MLKKIDALRVKALSDPLIVAALFLPFFKPMGLIRLVSAVDWLLVAGKAAALLFILALFLAHPRLSAVTVLLGAYQVLLLVSTLRSGGDLADWVYAASGVAGVCLLTEQCLDTDPKAMLRAVVWLLGGMCVLNLGSIPLFPNGIHDEWGMYFMGLDNAAALYIAPALGVTAIWARYRRWPYLVQLALLAVISATVFILWSATGIMAAAAFLALFLLFPVPGSGRVFNVCTLYAVAGLGFLLLVVLRMPEKFAFLIEDVLHKDVTLTARLGIWDAAIAAIGERPLLGYGILARPTIVSMLGNSHCHNFVLQTLFETGALGAAVYLAAFVLLVRPLMRLRRHYVGYFLAAALFALLVDFLAEVPIYQLPFLALMVMAFHAEKITAALEPDETVLEGGTAE